MIWQSVPETPNWVKSFQISSGPSFFFISFLDFGNIGEGYSVPCKQVYACQHFLDFSGEARQAGQVGLDLYKNFKRVGEGIFSFPKKQKSI